MVKLHLKKKKNHRFLFSEAARAPSDLSHPAPLQGGGAPVVPLFNGDLKFWPDAELRLFSLWGQMGILVSFSDPECSGLRTHRLGENGQVTRIWRKKEVHTCYNIWNRLKLWGLSFHKEAVVMRCPSFYGTGEHFVRGVHSPSYLLPAAHHQISGFDVQLNTVHWVSCSTPRLFRALFLPPRGTTNLELWKWYFRDLCCLVYLVFTRAINHLPTATWRDLLMLSFAGLKTQR